MKVALYARVSTTDKGQDTETQLFSLRQWAEAKGFKIVKEYIDQASAANMRERTQWRQLLKDVRTGGFDSVVVTKLDRAWRSVHQMHLDLEYLTSHNKKFVSISQDIDTGGSTGRLLLNILGSIAEFERELIRDRTREGLERAKSQGKTLGRPKGSKDKKQRKKSGYIKRWESI